MRRAAAMIAALASALALATGPADAKRTAPVGFYGVNFDREIQYSQDSVQTKTWGLMATSGVESARVIFDWSEAQPDAGVSPSLRITDAIVAYAAAHGVRVLPTVVLAPRWARVVPDKPESRPSNLPAYAKYLKMLVARYGPSGSFWTDRPLLPRLPIRAWQVWNEPDMPYQWQPRDGWQKYYGKLLSKGYGALKKADPRATVVMAALTNYSWLSLGQLYRHGGIHGHADAIALNAYTRSPKHLVEILRLNRGAMNRYGDKRVPIWVTEFGASASEGRVDAPGQEDLQTTDAGLARLVTHAYGALAKNRKKLRVGRAFWYTWASSYDPRKAIFDFAGLVQYGAGKHEPRPALAAYRSSARAREGCSKDVRGSCR